jgi:hypothetical protein
VSSIIVPLSGCEKVWKTIRESATNNNLYNYKSGGEYMAIERIETNLTDETAPAWLEDLLREMHVGQEFQERCRKAGRSAHAIAMMRKEHEENPFALMAFGAYVRGLAEIRRVSLLPILSWLSLDNVDTVIPKTARALSLFGRDLGFSVVQLKLMLRVSVGQSLGYAAVPLKAARRSNTVPGSRDAETWMADLDRLEEQYPLPAREEIREILRIVDSVYIS